MRMFIIWWSVKESWEIVKTEVRNYTEDDTGETACKNWANKFYTNNLKGKSQRKSSRSRWVNNIKLDLDVNNLWLGFRRLEMWRWTLGLHDGREYFNSCLAIAFSQKTRKIRIAPPFLLETHSFRSASVSRCTWKSSPQKYRTFPQIQESG
jgi:hypothetical protein